MSLAVWLVLWSLNIKGCELGEEFPIFSCSFSWYGSLIVELNGIWVLQAFYRSRANVFVSRRPAWVMVPVSNNLLLDRDSRTALSGREAYSLP
jgi:hypothetical protein